MFFPNEKSCGLKFGTVKSGLTAAASELRQAYEIGGNPWSALLPLGLQETKSTEGMGGHSREANLFQKLFFPYVMG